MVSVGEGPLQIQLLVMCLGKWGWSGRWNENKNIISLVIKLNAEAQHHSHGTQRANVTHKGEGLSPPWNDIELRHLRASLCHNYQSQWYRGEQQQYPVKVGQTPEMGFLRKGSSIQKKASFKGIQHEDGVSWRVAMQIHECNEMNTTRMSVSRAHGWKPE